MEWSFSGSVELENVAPAGDGSAMVGVEVEETVVSAGSRDAGCCCSICSLLHAPITLQ